MSDTVERCIIDPRPDSMRDMPVSLAMRVDDRVYVSGLIGTDRTTGELVEGGIEAEAKQTLENIKGLLGLAGVDMKNVIQATILLADLSELAVFNKVYKEFFPKNYPTRVSYQVGALAMGARVEVSAVAVRGKIIDVAASV